MNKKSLLVALCTALLATTAQADEVTLRTNKATGQSLTIALNAGVQAQLAWDGGSTSTVAFTGEEQAIPVQGAALTITTSQPITMLYAPDNGLTEVTLTDATNLMQLIVPGNALTALNLSGVPVLEELNCSDNQLAALTTGDCPNLVSLDCANNQITSILTSKNTSLQILNCAGNKLTALGVSSKEIKAVWCQNNQLTKIVLSTGADPQQLVAFNNQITTLNLTGKANLQELWLDNNALTTLDISSSSVRTLSASNNQLTSITHNTDDKKSMEDFYVDGNQLAPCHFVKVYNTSTKQNLMNWCIAPQRPFQLSENINVNDVVDATSFIRLNAWGQPAGFTLSWENDAHDPLVKGTDYTVSSYKTTFKTGQWKIRLVATSTQYPELTINSNWFRVIDPTGVETVQTNADTQIQARDGQIVVTTAQAQPLHIYHVSGKLVVNEQLSAGTHAWSLPAGVYIIEGKRVLVK